jgi:uncharacterized membrane protein
VYVVWTWATIWHRDPAATARLVLREDPGRPTADALLLVASVASMLAVAAAIAAGQAGGPRIRDLRAALAVASVALSWSVVQTVFTSHYARLYYSHPAGGIDFNQEAPPRFSDFAYLAFTVGMTFQVSDTSLQTAAAGRVPGRHPRPRRARRPHQPPRRGRHGQRTGLRPIGALIRGCRTRGLYAQRTYLVFLA